MKKIISLMKACMTENMSLFRIKSKSQTESSKKITPIILAIVFLFSIGSYAVMMMESLKEAHLEIVLLTLFVFFTTLMTFIEGIYKSGSLLFECKDDQLLFSLPIHKRTVLFIRMFKFYWFEFLYNSLFLLPAIVVYALNVKVEVSYYLTSIIALILIPIIPIILSSIVGGMIAIFSSRFKNKNIAQILMTGVLLLSILYVSFQSENIMSQIVQNGASIHQGIVSVYYPARAYTNLVMEFHVSELLVFILIHVLIIMVSILAFSKLYFKVNSISKRVMLGKKKTSYECKVNSPRMALIRKEWNKFINTPVLVVNSIFGLLLFMVACIAVCVNFEGVANTIVTSAEVNISLSQLQSYIPAILFGIICFGTLMSSITSSMISLEGKSFSILKSLPVAPETILLSKIWAAVGIIIPFILVGDVIVFIRFAFRPIEIVLLLLASIILPIVSQTIGILINLKYPKMDADNDSEVVKQSISSMVAVMIGTVLTMITVVMIIVALAMGITTNIVIFVRNSFLCLCGIAIIRKLEEKRNKEISKNLKF